MVKIKKQSLKVVAEAAKTSDECTIELKKPKYIKPFIHDDISIDFMSPKYQDVVQRKRVQHLLRQGVAPDEITMPFNTTLAQCQEYTRIEAKRFKFTIGVKFQPEPWILEANKCKERCTICTERAPLIAFCEWMDEFTDRETHERCKVPVCFVTCKACLEEAHATFLTKAQWLAIVLAAARTDNVQYEELHNAKDYECCLCNKHATDSTFVYIHYNDMWFNIPVCDEHFDLMIAPLNNVAQEGLDHEFTKSMNLSPHLQALLAVYQREKPVKKVPPKEKPVETKDASTCHDYDAVLCKSCSFYGFCSNREQQINESYKFKDEVTE